MLEGLKDLPMSQQDEILAKITRVIQANFNNSSLVVTMDTQPSGVDGWDSIKMVDIILDTEDMFCVRLSVEHIDRLRSVGDLVRAVESQIAA